MACCGSRTRTGCGRIENLSGGSITIVSPSSPSSILSADVTSNVADTGSSGGSDCAWSPIPPMTADTATMAEQPTVWRCCMALSIPELMHGRCDTREILVAISAQAHD